MQAACLAQLGYASWPNSSVRFIISCFSVTVTRKKFIAFHQLRRLVFHFSFTAGREEKAPRATALSQDVVTDTQHELR